MNKMRNTVEFINPSEGSLNGSPVEYRVDRGQYMVIHIHEGHLLPQGIPVALDQLHDLLEVVGGAVDIPVLGILQCGLRDLFQLDRKILAGEVLVQEIPV